MWAGQTAPFLPKKVSSGTALALSLIGTVIWIKNKTPKAIALGVLHFVY